MTREEILELLDKVYTESKHKEKFYHHICYGGNTVRMLDTWSEQEFINCKYKGRDVWDSPGCTNCDGIHQGFLSLEKYREFENYGMETLYRNLKAALLKEKEEVGK